jgi:Family of unknown function (DUF5662)
MGAHLRYASYVVRHKWFVFYAGFDLGAPLWRLVIHDWSKLTQGEWGPYVRKFYGNWGVAYGWDDADAIKARVDAAYSRAWLRHQHRNPHHWQHWLLREDDGPTVALRMPSKLVREMVADWMGAGRAITGRWEVTDWYAKNASKIVLHPATRDEVEELLGCAESHEYEARGHRRRSA